MKNIGFWSQKGVSIMNDVAFRLELKQIFSLHLKKFPLTEKSCFLLQQSFRTKSVDKSDYRIQWRRFTFLLSMVRGVPSALIPSFIFISFYFILYSSSDAKVNALNRNSWKSILNKHKNLCWPQSLVLFEDEIWSGFQINVLNESQHRSVFQYSKTASQCLKVRLVISVFHHFSHPKWILKSLLIHEV